MLNSYVGSYLQDPSIGFSMAPIGTALNSLLNSRGIHNVQAVGYKPITPMGILEKAIRRWNLLPANAQKQLAPPASLGNVARH